MYVFNKLGTAFFVVFKEIADAGCPIYDLLNHKPGPTITDLELALTIWRKTREEISKLALTPFEIARRPHSRIPIIYSNE